MARSRQSTPLPRGFGAIWTTVALDLVGFGIVVPILGRYAERFGASGLQVGLLFASFSLSQFVFAPLLGRLSDRIGRKPVILISLVGTAVGSFVTGLAGSLWVLFLGRILDGASGASVAVVQGAVSDIAPPSERPRLLGLLGAAIGVGFVIGPALGGLASLGGVHVPFFVAGTVALVNAVVAYVRVPETRVVDRDGAERTRRVRERHEPVRVWNLAFVGLMSIMAFSGFEATFSLLAGHRFGLTEAGVAAIFVCIGLVLVGVQGALIQPVVTIVGVHRALQIGLASNAVGLLTLSRAGTWPTLAVALVLLIIGQGLSSPNLTSIVVDRVGEDHRGEALGFQQSATSLGRVAGPALAGALYDKVSIGSPYVVGSMLCLAALMVVLAQAESRPAVLSSSR